MCCAVASDTSETATETGSETETETENTVTPRTEGIMNAKLRKTLPTPPVVGRARSSKVSNPTSKAYRKFKPSAKHHKKPKDAASLPVPEVLSPIVFHADFGVSEDLSVMQNFVSVLQPGVNIQGVEKSHKTNFDVCQAATAGVNGGNGVIHSPESVVARTSGTGNHLSNSVAKKTVVTKRVQIAMVAAGATSTGHGMVQPVEAVRKNKSGAGPASRSESSSSSSSEEETTSNSTCSIVIAKSGSVARVLPAPAPRKGSRVSSREGSQVNSRSPSPSTSRDVAATSHGEFQMLHSASVIPTTQPFKRPATRPGRLMVRKDASERNRHHRGPAAPTDPCCSPDCKCGPREPGSPEPHPVSKRSSRPVAKPPIRDGRQGISDVEEETGEETETDVSNGHKQSGGRDTSGATVLVSQVQTQPTQLMQPQSPARQHVNVSGTPTTANINLHVTNAAPSHKQETIFTQPPPQTTTYILGKYT